MQLFKPSEYLKIDIASNYGHDKESWDYRINWFNDNAHQLLDLLSQAEKPAMYYAGVMAWQDHKNNIPSGYPVGLDATSSNIQLMSVLTGDYKAMKLCNVMSTGSREDAYTFIYRMMVRELDQETKLEREQVKQAIMVSLFGSTAKPKEVFGSGILLETFYKVMEKYLPEVWELNKLCLAIWDNERLSYDWVLPDNFHVHIKIMDTVYQTVTVLGEEYSVPTVVNKPIEEGRSLSANICHSVDSLIVREITRRCNYDPSKINKLKRILKEPIKQITLEPTHKNKMVTILWKHYKETNYLSARIFDYLTASNLQLIDVSVIQELVDSLPTKPFQVISIHDQFRCLPNYCNDLRKQYNQQLYLLAKSNLLSNVLKQILGTNVIVSKGKFDARRIQNAEYALS